MNYGKEFQMEDIAKKLSLWHTKTFRPDVGRAGAGSDGGRRPAAEGGSGVLAEADWLPVSRGCEWLHILAYEAFFHALEFYLGSHHVPDLFHVRSMTIRAQDMIFHSSYRPMRDCGFDDEGIFVYRDGTLDNVTKMVCNYDSNDSSSSSSFMNNSSSSKESRKSSNNPICLVPLDDLFPRMDIVSLG
ncbi:uncharacterized protein LOC109841920 [Asparagus officinalis]|uniref:uncharacterized protein LOC109841920 n=1 Tax=Asparagus officinalis TaxID=4686 RepID=UPI00098E353C|nr:uncharacterized protein LOC109841920 [Asparagus officinalis]